MTSSRAFSLLRLSSLISPTALLRRSFSLANSPALLSPRVHRDDVRRVLAFTWENGSVSKHPFTWLKDACPCSSCAHPTTLNRRTTLQQLDLNCYPQNITLNDTGSELNITWNDGHKSIYSYGWLQDHCFANPKKDAAFPVKTWSRDHTPQQFKWKDIVNEDSSLYAFILTLKTEGVCLVKNAPKNNDGLGKLVDAIGFPWCNHYAEYFDVVSKNDPSNIAYTSETLSPHIDLPYYYEPPGSQFLHCIARTPDVEGGENQLVDGFFVAEALRQEDPEAFQLLCETQIHYWDYGTDFLKDFHLQHSQRVIHFDEEGKYSRIIFSTHFRDTNKPCVPLEKVDLFYHAIRKFEDLLYRESIEHDTQDGDIVVVNNHRVLHGRSAYRITGDGMRYVRGTYITWDILNSRLRRLQGKLGK